MSNRVNPPPVIRFHQKNPYKPGSNEYRFAHEMMEVIRQQNVILEQLWRRTGAGTDLVSETASREAYGWDTGAYFEQEPVYNFSVTDGAEDWNIVEKSTLYNALEFDYVIATNSAKVYLPEFPSVTAVVRVVNDDGSTITIEPYGSAKINGHSDAVLRRKGISIDFVYDGENWRAA